MIDLTNALEVPLDDALADVDDAAKTARIWDAHFATMSTKDLVIEVCTRRLRGLVTLSRDEMRLAGYPDSMPGIDSARESSEPGAR
jgi:hypothetical protein